MRKLVWWGIRGYQLTLSAFLGRTCRFEPSCSHYAQEAVMVHGVCKGGWLALKRIARCGPWGGQGYDPVTPRRNEERGTRNEDLGGSGSKAVRKAASCCCCGRK